MKHIFKLILFAATMLLMQSVFGQILIPFAGTRPTDTAYAARSLRVDSVVRLVRYSSADTNKVLGVTANGTVVLRTKSNGTGTLSWPDTATTPGLATQYDLTHTPTLQTVTNAGNMTDHNISVGGIESGFIGSPGFVTINEGAGGSAKINYPFGGTMLDTLPNKSGTFAMLSDIEVTQAVLDDTAAAIRADFPSAGSSPFGTAWAFSDNAHNSEFMVTATAIIKNGGVYSPPDSIDWFILTSGGHGSSFFSSVAGNQSDQYLEISYPRVKYVFYCSANNDETLASYLLNIGATVGIDKARFAIYRPAQYGVRLTGQGTNTWIENDGNTNILDESTYDASDGSTKFNIGAVVTYPVPYYGLSITYLGSHNYHIKRSYSGLGMYNVSFTLLDQFNNLVTVNPSSDDEVQIALVGQIPQQVFAGTWGNRNEMLANSSANFWVRGDFELYMRVDPLTSTSNIVRWQTAAPNFTVTTYKIYRDTDPNFGSPTLITTSATPGSFTDTGLSAGTIYYYKEVGTVSGVDTYITTFPCTTKL